METLSPVMNTSVAGVLRSCPNCGCSVAVSGEEHRPHPEFSDKPRRRVLSPREVQIVRLIQRAKSNKEIADELCLTPGTAKQYIHLLFRKLGIRNRTELALWSREFLGDQ